MPEDQSRHYTFGWELPAFLLAVVAMYLVPPLVIAALVSYWVGLTSGWWQSALVGVAFDIILIVLIMIVSRIRR